MAWIRCVARELVPSLLLATMLSAISALAASKSAPSPLFKQLVDKAGPTEVSPGMAESWSIDPDGKRYTFILRRTAGSGSGGKIDAQSIRDSLRSAVSTALTPALSKIENANAVASGRQSSEQLGVTAIDDSTLEIRLGEPDPEFLSKLVSDERPVAPIGDASPSLKAGYIAQDKFFSLLFREGSTLVAALSCMMPDQVSGPLRVTLFLPVAKTIGGGDTTTVELNGRKIKRALSLKIDDAEFQSDQVSLLANVGQPSRLAGDFSSSANAILDALEGASRVDVRGDGRTLSVDVRDRLQDLATMVEGCAPIVTSHPKPLPGPALAPPSLWDKF